MESLHARLTIWDISENDTDERWCCNRCLLSQTHRKTASCFTIAIIALSLIIWIGNVKTLYVDYQSLKVTQHGVQQAEHSVNTSILIVDVTRPASLAAVRRDLDALRFHDLVLIGVFCQQQDYVRRGLYRTTTSQLRVAGVDQRFVVCANEKNPITEAVKAEISTHQDILVLDCMENMNNGKSFDYFRFVRQRHPSYRFYAKADLDTFILYHNLAFVLDSSPDKYLYLGCTVKWSSLSFQTGAMYVVSADLVQDLEMCGAECTGVEGPEDIEVGRALDRFRGKSLQWSVICDRVVLYFTDKPEQPDFASLHENMVYVHNVKNPEVWWDIYTHYVNLLARKSVRALPLQQ